MYRNILLDIPIRLLGVSPGGSVSATECLSTQWSPPATRAPKPRTVRFASSRTRLTAWLFRSPRSLVPAHPRKKYGRILRPSGVRWGQRGFTMGDRERGRVNHDNLPARLLSITDSSSRPTPFLSVINSKQESGVINQSLVTLQHTLSVIGALYIFYGICFTQDVSVTSLGWG